MSELTNDPLKDENKSESNLEATPSTPPTEVENTENTEETLDTPEEVIKEYIDPKWIAIKESLTA